MMSSGTEASLDRPFHLLLVDDDSVFRLGLRLGLSQFPDLRVVAEAASGETALQILAARFQASAVAGQEPIDLVVLNLSLGQFEPSQIQGLTLCQQIKVNYPDLSVVLLSALTEPVMLEAARQAGADGYCLKAAPVAELAAAMRQVGAGKSYWSRSPVVETQAASPVTFTASDRATVPKIPGVWAIARRNWRINGIKQIEAALVEIEAQLQSLDQPTLDRAVLAGRRRELLASRWLVKRLLATPTLPEEPEEQAISEPENLPSSEAVQPVGIDRPPSALLVPEATSETGITDRRLQALLFDSILAKLQTSLPNQTGMPLEVDILREEKKRDLFYLILRKFEALLDELRFSQVQVEQLLEKRSMLLLDLWRSVLIDFFGKYYTVNIRGYEVEVVSSIEQDAAIVQTELLDKIPFIPDLIAHLLFQFPLVINSVPYSAGNPEAIARAELVLENLVVQVANAIVQPLLNRFANVEIIKQNFYDRRLMSSREIERFRNDLSWKYRLARLVAEPRDIFESQYRLFCLQGYGIKVTSIYAPRNQELEQLSGIPLVVTLALETRDAIAPRFRAAISVVGSGLVYVLTDVIGRGIGLIGRGILKGIGNAWQDGRFNRK